MRKLLSVGALLAASTLGLWQAEPAMARDSVVVVVPHHHHHHRYYRIHHHRHVYYYDYYR